MADPSINVAQRATTIARAPRPVTNDTGPTSRRNHT